MCKVRKTYLTHNKILMDVRGYTTHSVIKESTDVPICTTVGGTFILQVMRTAGWSSTFILHIDVSYSLFFYLLV